MTHDVKDNPNAECKQKFSDDKSQSGDDIDSVKLARTQSIDEGLQERSHTKGLQVSQLFEDNIDLIHDENQNNNCVPDDILGTLKKFSHLPYVWKSPNIWEMLAQFEIWNKGDQAPCLCV